MSAAPWWAPALISAAISPVGMLLVALICEQRLLRPHEQYVSFFYGDVGLACAAGLGAYVLQHAPHRPAWCRSGPVLGLVIVVAFVLGLAAWWADSTATTVDSNGLQMAVYTRSQLLSPTKVFHNVVCYPALGLIAATYTVPALWITAPAGHQILDRLLELLIVCLIGFWLAAGLWWDPRHLKPAAHIEARHWYWR